ncbi:hypothetical protein BGX28_001684 [Mortierella sp. GBA30]|nr:hypothetical protein BGX28_001684 [Mortierella sp. GBA30]
MTKKKKPSATSLASVAADLGRHLSLKQKVVVTERLTVAEGITSFSPGEQHLLVNGLIHQAEIRDLRDDVIRVKAIWIQNYEPHEYPIPRRFVILPERKNPSAGCDLSNLFKDKIRL